jgi:hypothetical protein
MNSTLNRRHFLQRAALAAGALTAVRFNILHAASAGDKLRCVVIGCGGRGMSHLSAAMGQ